MLKGVELGAAIKVAIDKKLAAGGAESKAAIARHFGVKPPSIHDWIKRGSIAKDKLPELWRYFSDVVGDDHWGLSSPPPQWAHKTKEGRKPYDGELSDDEWWLIMAYRKGDKKMKAAMLSVAQLVLPDRPGLKMRTGT